ncbi:MAG: ArsR/SmtB family transcription factor [Promethearchaeota archaeon]
MSNDLFEELDLIMRLLSCQLNQVSEKGKPTTDLDVVFDELLHLLSHRTRRRMLSELAKTNLFVNEIVERLNEHPQSIIRHLRTLREKNMIVPDVRINKGHKGRPRTYYSLRPVVRQALTEVEKDESIPTQIDDDIALLFPRLQVLKSRLRETTKPSELKKLALDAENLLKTYQKATEECQQLQSEALSKIKQIKVQ